MTAERRSPLAPWIAELDALSASTQGAVVAVEIPFLAQIDLRVDADASGRLALPREPNTVRAEEGRAALWLGPDEWLVTGAPGSAHTIVAELQSALVGIASSVMDVSANRAVIDLSGSSALELLARGCSIDLHPRSWRAGLCAQTILGKTQVILEQRDDLTRIYVRPSFAGYLLDWLTAASETI